VAHGPSDESVGFELAQVLPQHLNGHSGHGSAQLAESKGAFAEAAKDHGFPTALNHPDRRVYGTLAALDIACTRLVHVATPNEQGTSKCLIVKEIERAYTVVNLWRPLVCSV
jgi:hypothetical protein